MRARQQPVCVVFGAAEGFGVLLEVGSSNPGARRAFTSEWNWLSNVDEFTDTVSAACSFSADTEVVLADGSVKAISEAVVSEWVIAQYPISGEGGARRVTASLPHTDWLFTLQVTVQVGSGQGPVVKSWCNTSRGCWPCLRAVSV